MDLKLLLLKSLSSKKPISGSHRIYYGKSRFVIKYLINGKFLSIKSIKSNRKRTTWSQRIKYYNRLHKIQFQKKNNDRSRGYLSTTTIWNFDDKETMTEDFYRHTQDVQTETVQIALATKKTSTQTIDIEKHSKEIQTERIKKENKTKDISKLSSTRNVTSKQNQAVSFKSTAQQTIASFKFNRNMTPVNHTATSRNSSKSCQTDSNTECKGIQCKRSTQTKATNTDVNTRNSFTQAVQKDLLSVLSPVEAKKCLALPAKDFEVFVYMLNEIGERVVNQNQILSNNTEIMKQMMKTNMETESKHVKNSCSSISTQTEQLVRIQMINNFSQTKANCIKPRKLLLFKGRNSQRNK